MTCSTCNPDCPFRWKEWKRDSFAIAMQPNAKIQASISQSIDDSRAAGVDRSFIEGIGKSTAMSDLSKLVVGRSKPAHGPALTVKEIKR